MSPQLCPLPCAGQQEPGYTGLVTALPGGFGQILLSNLQASDKSGGSTQHYPWALP